MERKIAHITTNAGDVASLPSTGVTCIVGSNNVGKSQLLRDIVSLLESRSIVPVVLSKVEVQGSLAHVTIEEVTDWLDKTAERQLSPTGHSYIAMGGGQQLPAQAFVHQFQHNDPSFLGPTRPFFCWYADAGSRVGLGGGSLGHAGMGPNPHPLARLFRDGELEERLSDIACTTFGFPLTLDRINGNVRLLVGEPSVPAPPMNRPTREYAEAVAALPPLESQGDGVKSFIGLALHAMVGEQSIILIDEPEAFLHQAQAKALGRWVASESQARHRQVVIATHSRDIILGLLAGRAEVTVLRLTREGNDSHLRQLKAHDLTSVWDDPILRYSNVLDGLFYRSVVICEADADCRFYSAVLDYYATITEGGVNPDEVLFVPSGGKDRIPSIARSLLSLGVETYAIADFDVLKSKAKCKEIVEALGGDWGTADTDYATMANALNANSGSGWEQTKTQGLAAVPQGEASQAATNLLSTLRTKRVLIVPVGEMEGFDRTIGSHGTEWVSGMLDRRGHESCKEAIGLVMHISG